MVDLVLSKFHDRAVVPRTELTGPRLQDISFIPGTYCVCPDSLDSLSIVEEKALLRTCSDCWVSCDVSARVLRGHPSCPGIWGHGGVDCLVSCAFDSAGQSWYTFETWYTFEIHLKLNGSGLRMPFFSHTSLPDGLTSE